MNTSSMQTEQPSLGERLTPYLMAALEACLIDAIIIGLDGFNIFQVNTPLMPQWMPFVLMVGTLWLLRTFAQPISTNIMIEALSARQPVSDDTQKHRILRTPHIMLFTIFLAVLTLSVIWLSVYSQTASIFDSSWMHSLVSDALQQNSRFYHVLYVAVFSTFIYWRCTRLLRSGTQSSHAFNMLRLGVIIFVLVVISRTLQTGQTGTNLPTHDDPALFFLIPIFLFLALATHALTQAIFSRSLNLTGFQGSVLVQERSIVFFIGSLCLVFLLLTFFVASGNFPALLIHVLEVGYFLFVSALASILVILATPFIWLFSLIVHDSSTVPTINKIKSPCFQIVKSASGVVHKVVCTGANPANPDLASELILVLQLILPVLFVLFLFLLAWQLLRKRRGRTRLVVKQGNVELHDSVWSWLLFWSQLKAIIRALLGRRTTSPQVEPSINEDEVSKGPPEAESIRAIYRALLSQAAQHGYPRLKNETPNEYRKRLNKKTPLAEPQRIGVLTEAYMDTRYGGTVPDEVEVARVHQAWIELEWEWQKEKSDLTPTGGSLPSNTNG